MRRDAHPDFAEAPGLRDMIDTALALREGRNVDEIGDALAIALEAIEEHSGGERYQRPDIATRIRAVREGMEQLQLLLDGSLF